MVLGAGCGRFGFDLVSNSEPGNRPEASLDGGRTPSDGGDASGSSDAGCADCTPDGSTSPADGSIVDGSIPIDAPDVIWTSDTNLSFDNSPDHVCAEGGDMVSYSVVGLLATSAVLDHVPDAGCLVEGDEVLLISMRGAGTENTSVGHFELLRVALVQGAEVTFQTPKQGVYGAAGSDADIGIAPGQQRVVLLRVPTYGNATLGQSATLRVYAWDGARGGVMAMRVQGELRIDGAINVSGAGYAGGPRTASASTTGRQGESIGGRGSRDTTANFGGGGGGLADGMGCRQSGSGGGGAGHALTGSAGVVQDCSGVGGGLAGASVGDVDRLLFGSGGGAGGTDNVRTDNPPGGQGGNGGGIVLLIANRVTGSGSIAVRGTDGEGDAPGVECNGASSSSCWDHSGPGGGGAGGTLRIEASSVAPTLGFDFQGGSGGNGRDELAGNGGPGSRGRLVTFLQP